MIAGVLKRKVKAMNFQMQYPEVVPFFVEIGESWVVMEELIDNVVEFVFLLYGKSMDNIDTLRYHLFCPT